jgi:protein disulfide isomerase family A protein 5
MYNISGYPTILYFKNGEVKFSYGGERDKQGIIDWMLNPMPAKEKEVEPGWEDEENVQVTFLNDNNFNTFIKEHKSVLVMFYAPCKPLFFI